MPISVRSSMIRLCLLATLVVPFAVAGCSSGPPKLQFGSAKPTGPKIAAQPPQGGSVPLAQWPDACKLLSEKEIRAILPQASGFERTPIKVTVMNFDPLNDAPSGTTGDVPKGGCEYKFGLPSEYESEGNSSIKVVFGAIADPALVQKRYEEDRDDARRDGQKFTTQKFSDLGDSLGTGGCYVSSNTVNCYQGAYEFDVSGISTADGVGEYPKSEPNWTKKVLTQVVRTLGQRMS